MANLQAEVARQMGIKAALVSTTNTQGWNIVKELADKVTKKAIQDALDEEDSKQGEAKRFKAKALQKGFAELFETIENVKQYNPSASDDGGLGDLEWSEHEAERELGNQ